MATLRTSSEGASLWHNRSFRLFFTGQFVTNAGDSLYTVAVLWIAHELSGSTVVTGALNAVLLLPWLLQIFAGPLVDRYRIEPLLIGSQLVQGVVVLALPFAAVTDRLSVGVLFTVVPVLTMAQTVMSPMRAAVLPRIVDENRLSRANSALATITLGLDMVFDALGGVFIAVFGATALFLFDSVTFAVAAALFAGIAIPTADTSEPTPETSNGSVIGSYVADLRAGVDVLRGTVFVELVAMTAIVNFATGVTLAILPSFGGELAGAAAYGLLLGALGIGRLVGSLAAPSFEGVGFGRITFGSYALTAGVWLAAVLAPSTPLTVVCFGLAWIPIGVTSVLTATLNQTVFATDVLGRISTIKGTASGATLPIGSLLGGGIAEVVGTTTTMALAALGFGVAGAYVLSRSHLRRLPAVGNADPAAFGVSDRSNHSSE
ncbi:MFS transporter [Halopiger goleimassiliensis]|uniref:MFS transporter n=1 Tax=Halopiger goleimassiliensis TaxID=1293048 RepID=UPI000677C993|nr:MFS transporter [Halopiger goleimassiliensis]